MNKPDLNDNIYLKEVWGNAVKNMNNVPLKVCNGNNEFVSIGVCQEAELIEDADGLKLRCVGLIFYGGTNENVELVDGVIKDMLVTGIGIATEYKRNRARRKFRIKLR